MPGFCEWDMLGACDMGDSFGRVNTRASVKQKEKNLISPQLEIIWREGETKSAHFLESSIKS